MKTTRYLLIFLFYGSLFVGCNNDSDNGTEDKDPIEFTKEGELYLVKPSGDTLQKIDIEIADNFYERETGLMHRYSMETNQGMLFIYPDEALRSFWMQNTYIPLDLIFFDSDSTAVSFQENAKPMDETSLPSGVPAQFILEINAGLVEDWGIETGDKIDFEKLP